MMFQSAAEKSLPISLRVLPFCALALCLAGALGQPAPALAASLNTLLRQGTEAYGAGNYEQALESFSQAVSESPTDALALYNQGTALYKLGRFDEAAQVFGASTEAHKMKKNRARAEYNQGRALIAAAGDMQEPGKKKELLLAAKQAFHQALRDDPSLKAARKGVVDCRKELEQFQEQQSQTDQQQQGQPQNQDGDQHKQQDLQDKLNEASQQQQEMADQSKEAGSENSQPGSSQEMAAQQQSVRQTLEKLKEEISKEQTDQGDNAKNQEDLTKKLDQAINEQKKAEEALKQGNIDKAQEHQQQAADALNKMATELRDTNEEQSAPPAVNDDNDNEGEEEMATATEKQEGKPQPQDDKSAGTVADILDGEKALHEMRRLRMKQQRPASGKDW